jgi:hypothetical protein
MTAHELVRRAHALYNNPNVPTHVNRHNRRQWVRSVQLLGDKWLIAKPIERNQ